MSDAPAPRAARGGVRWFVAVVSVLYGCAKLTGSQFTVLDSELTRPLGDVRGFWLVWYFFGYSTVYGTIVALLQIVAGLLMVWPETSLLAALLLLPVYVNIVLIDVFFGVDLGATLMAMAVLGGILLSLAPHARSLRRAVILAPAPERRPRRVIAMLALLMGAAAFTWWIANYNNRSPTTIDGVWTSAPSRPGEPPQRDVTTAFFERNRAHMLVVRMPKTRDHEHHFEIDSAGTVRVWRTWLRKDTLVLQGGVDSSGVLRLVGQNGWYRNSLVLWRAPVRGVADEPTGGR
jgi:hypothetical protein